MAIFHSYVSWPEGNHDGEISGPHKKKPSGYD